MMDKNDIKKVLAGLSITGLLAGMSLTGSCTNTDTSKSS
jgi:radical SAM modification target selenobiotic family peptide